MTKSHRKYLISPFNLRIFLIFLSVLTGIVDSYSNTRQFHSVASSNELSSVKVNTIFQSRDGMIWIAGPGGLNMYDGYHYRHFPNSEIDPSSSVNGVTDIQEDANGNLWLRLNDENTAFFEMRKESLVPLPIFPSDSNPIYSTAYPFLIDSSLNLWIADGNHLFCYDKTYRLVKKYDLKILGSLKNMRMANYGNSQIIFDDIGKLYIVTPEGIKELSQSSVKEIPSGWSEMTVTGDNLWIASGSGALIWKFNLNAPNQEIISLPTNLSISTAIRDMAADGNGKLWIATDHEGIFVYDPLENKYIQHYSPDFSSNRHTIPSNDVSALLFDRHGNLWVGFSKNGLRVSPMSPRGITDYFNPESGEVISLLTDRHDHLWIGTDGRGLFRKDSDNMAITKCRLPDVSYMSLIEDGKGRIIAGTYDHGIFMIDTDGSIRHLNAASGKIPNDRAWFLNEDREGKLWVSSSVDDPFVIHPDGNISKLKFSSGNPIRVMASYYEGGDSIFLSTGYGFIAFNIYDFTHGAPHLSNNKGNKQFLNYYISAFHKDADNILWLGHHNGMTAWNLDNDSIYHLIGKEEAAGQYVSWIGEDRNRRIWAGTRNGLLCIGKSFSKDDGLSFRIRTFHESDGLRSNYISGNTVNIKSNGDMVFGGIDGYTMLSPAHFFPTRPDTALIHFTGLKINNEYVKIDSVYNGFSIDRSIKYIKKLHIPNTDDNLTIEFASSDVVNNHARRYAYKIINNEKTEQEWIVTQENSITLNHLKPGNYTLIVKHFRDIADLENTDGTTLDIIVERPLYLRWWAILIYLLLITAGVMLWIHIQKKRNLKKLTSQAEKYIEESKLRFFTNVSHDLRTQLTLVLTPLQLLEKEPLPPDSKNKVNDIKHNAEILLRHINSLLDFRKLDAGGETINTRTCEIKPFIEEVFSRFAGYAKSKDMTYTLDMKGCDCYLTLDFDKTSKIISNIISNAFKYTEPGGSIGMKVSVKSTTPEEESLIIAISDTGKGIKDDEKTKIFDRFFQSDHSDHEPGNGIGLHIVREYVRIMGGTIEVTDNTPKGSIFTVTLPSSHAAVQHETEESAEQPSTVLFADDNSNLRRLVKEGLSKYYHIILAADGKEALEQLEKEKVDIVVSDVMMPRLDGLQLCKVIKNNLDTSHIPVILLTARTTDIDKKEGLELGADDYVTKPFNFDILRLRIEKFLELSKQKHDSFRHQIEVNPSEITITSIDAEFIENALKIVEENLCDGEFSVNTLSDKLAMSRSNLYKKIMAITGSGPADFIRIIRLKRACQLLKESGMRVSEIAYMVGFNSPKRFSVNFKAEYGLTPSEYQQKYGKNNPDTQSTTDMET